MNYSNDDYTDKADDIRYYLTYKNMTVSNIKDWTKYLRGRERYLGENRDIIDNGVNK